MDRMRQIKVQQFEEFVDCRLKPDLVRAIAERDKIFEEEKVFSPHCLLKHFQVTEELTTLLIRQLRMGDTLVDAFLLSVQDCPAVVRVLLYIDPPNGGSDISDLRRNIENLQKNGVTSLRSMVNLGSEVYMQADVSDTRHIFVDIGLGFHVELTWSEALEFIQKKEASLTKKIEDYTGRIARIKAQIKMVCEGIRELLQIPAEL